MRTLATCAMLAVFLSPAMAADHCEIQAFSGANGTTHKIAVHAEPSATSKTVGEIFEYRPDGEDYWRGVDIVGVDVQDGWVKVRAEAAHGDNPAVPGGWIDQDTFDFVLQSYAGRSRPDATAPISYEEKGDWIAMDRVNQILDCSGTDWLKLDVTGLDGKRHQAWFRGICSIEETTCDGLMGDGGPKP